MGFPKANPWRFQPGQSGNPGGRPNDDVVSIARKLTDKAFAAIVLDLRVPERRLLAAREILDRGWGKVPQDISGHLSHTLAVGGIDAPPRETLEQWLARHNRDMDALEGHAEPPQDAAEGNGAPGRGNGAGNGAKPLAVPRNGGKGDVP
jgi:hypothetical protein